MFGFGGKGGDGYRGLTAIVTGLPRSGTSFVAGLLVRLGLSPGPRLLLRPGNRHNRYGYYEHVPLNWITDRILKEMGRDFDLNLPAGREEFLRAGLEQHMRKIKRKVENGRIEVYKDNKLVLYPELYADIFPQAGFVFVTRDADARFASRFGKTVARREWEDFNARRLAMWHDSPVSGRALTVAYEDFFDDARACVDKVCGYLALDAGEERRRKAAEFFRPSRKR
jgi:hypothetical protein